MANLKGNFASKYHSIYIYSQICIENKTDKISGLRVLVLRWEEKR